MLLYKSLALMTKTSQTLIRIVQQSNRCIESLPRFQFPSKVFFIDTDTQPNFIQLILLNPSFKVSAIKELNRPNLTSLFRRFTITKDKAWSLRVTRSSSVGSYFENSLF